MDISHRCRNDQGSMEERVIACSSGSDEAPTDVSSSPGRNSSSSSDVTSTPTRELRDEADKQILQWASKLELESIELRERSSALLTSLNERYESLDHAARRFGEIEKSLYMTLCYNLQEQITNRQLRQNSRGTWA